MPHEPTDEARAVAAAMVRQSFGETGSVGELDIRAAQRFIAAADALIAFRMAQSGPKGLPSSLCDRIRRASVDDGGLDRNEDDGA